MVCMIKTWGLSKKIERGQEIPFRVHIMHKRSFLSDNHSL